MVRIQLFAAGQGEEMGLSLAAGDIDQILLFQARGSRQHRTGHDDIVVLGEPAKDFERGIRRSAQAARQIGLGLGLDFLDQAAEDVVEQTDMVFLEMVGPRETAW